MTTLKRNAKIKVGKFARVAVPISSLPAGLTTGTYHLLLQVTDSSGRVEFADTGSSVEVTAEIISISASFVSVPSNVLKAGALLAVTDTGNTNDQSIFTATIGLSTDAGGQNIVATTTIILHPAKLLIRVNKTTKIRVTGWKSLVATFPAGSYYLTVTIADASDRIASAVSLTNT